MKTLLTATFLMAFALTGCRITEISREGPKPELGVTSRADEGFPDAPIFCTDLGGTLLVTGSGFSPLPAKVVTDEIRVLLPSVVLRADATETDLLVESVDTESITAVVPAGMAIGTYTLVITNPNEYAGELADAVHVVPPPEITAVTTSAIPGVATPPVEPVLCTELGGTWSVTGSGFHAIPLTAQSEADNPTDVPVVLLEASDGTRIELTDMTFVSTSELTVVVPTTLTAGDYDLIVVSPSGCEDTFPVILVPPPEITAIAPVEGSNSTTTDVSVTGTGFRQSSDATLPVVVLDELTGADSAALTGLSLVSATQVDGTVPSGLEVGLYDVTLTNPEGCHDTLLSAFEVIGVPIDLCDYVDPGFGWVEARTRVEICADNSGGHGLQSTPEVFIIIDSEKIPMIREAYLSAGTASEPSLMSAMVPSQTDDFRIVVGGPYDIRVENPDGSVGFVPGAFTILPDPPPDITAVTPNIGSQAATNFLLTVTGKDFKDGTLPDGTTPILTIALLAEDGTEVACGASTVTADGTTATCTMTLPGEGGNFLVRVQHEDDGSFDTFSLFAVTAPSLNPETIAVSTDTDPKVHGLNTARRAHGVALGEDDVGNRFLYAVGGHDTTAAALSTVETAALGKFGAGGEWFEQSTLLPSGRSGLSLVRVGRWLYAIGGTSDDADAGTIDPVPTGTVLRAQILGFDTAPIIDEPTAASGGSLAVGTYYYKVSAVMAGATFNPLGESLPSDEESVRVVSANSTVTLSWLMPASAPAVDHFRIYRSTAPNQLSGSEVLLAETVNGSTFTYVDDGSETPGSEEPLLIGSLSEWVAVAELNTPRFDAAATSVRIDASTVYLYVAGGRASEDVADVLDSTEWIALEADGSNTVNTWQTDVAANLVVARSEHVLAPISHDLVEDFPEGTFGLVVIGGSVCGVGTTSNCAVLTDDAVEFTLVTTTGGDTGLPEGWCNVWPGSGQRPLQNPRAGHTAVIVNDNMYSFTGWGGNGTDNFANDSEENEPLWDDGEACEINFPNHSAAPLDMPDELRYRSAMAYFGAYFYFVGGSIGLAPSDTRSLTARASF